MLPPNYTGFTEFFFSVPEEFAFRGKINLRLWVENGYVRQIQVLDFYWSSYDLRNLMKIYGQPDEIWISTYRRYPPIEPPPFSFAVLYSQKGILISNSITATRQGDMLQGCLEPRLSLMLWQSETTLDFKEATRQFDWDISGSPYLLLQEATNMDVSTFYETFKGTNSEVCIKTPSNLWPDG